MPARERVIAWAHSSQQTLLREALGAANLQLAAVGSDDLASAAELADAFGVSRETDLRHASSCTGAGMVWFLMPRSLTQDECHVLRERSMKALCLHPPVISLSDAAADTSNLLEARFAPLMQVSPAARAATDVLESFGERRCLQIFMGCGLAEGSTVGRLFDAMAMVQHMLGPAQAVTASMASATTDPLDSLDHIRGSMNVHVRCAGRASASITVTNEAGRWSRSMAMVGDAGMLTMDDSGFHWTHRNGSTVAEHRVPPPHSAGALLGVQAARWLESHDASDPPPNVPAVLSMCEAARLSCLTGQPEHPGRVMKVLSKP
jgi:hypothetical protein